MDTKTARKKSFDVEYVQVTEENIKEVAEWSGGRLIDKDTKDAFVQLLDRSAINQRQTKAYIGDFVVHHSRAKTYRSFPKKTFWKQFETLDTEGAAHAEHHARDAGTGKYVSDEYAEEHPDTTVVEDDDVDAPGDGLDLPKDAGLD